MIKTSVGENHQAQRRNNNIRLSGEHPNILVYAPPPSEASSDNFVEFSLRSGSRTTNLGHYLATFFRCKDICQASA